MSNPPSAYLSRIRLDPFKREARRAIASVDAMHQIACSLVSSDRLAGNVLWRWEPESHPTALLQSSVPPDRAKLPAGFSMPDQSHDLSHHLTALSAGQSIRYRSTVSPTKDVRLDGRRAKRRVSLPRADIPEWWNRKAAAAGLDLDDCGEAAITMGSASLRGGKIPVVRIDGYARVRDPITLRTSILTGIGRAKCYGCGLLTVSRIT